jgi:dihydroorotase
MEVKSVRIRRPDDWHVHLREDELLKAVVHETAWIYRRALVMPNTKKPILSGRDAWEYHFRICHAIGHTRSGEMLHQTLRQTGYFQPLMTIKITPETTPTMIRQSVEGGVVIAGKLYPDGVTTGSENGVRDFEALDPVFAAMTEAGLVLCLHGEMPDAFCLDREAKFLNVLVKIRQKHPRLRIVMEHITTAAAVETILALPDVAATITVHHLYLTLDDVIGGLLRPHNFCKPVAKWPDDRSALIAAATSGNPKFFLGTDSAPHDKGNKECAGGCAGVYVPGQVAMALLVELFTTGNSLGQLEAFTSINGANFYGQSITEETIEIVPDKWVVPELMDGIVPFMAGETLNWSVPNEYWNLTARY